MKVCEKKKNQNYRKKPNMCSNCKYYGSEIKEVLGPFDFVAYVNETKKRCTKGGFAVQKTATCDLWEKSE